MDDTCVITGIFQKTKLLRFLFIFTSLYNVLPRIKFIALDTLKARKHDKLTQLEKMCLEIAYDLAVIDIDTEGIPTTIEPISVYKFTEPFSRTA